MLGYDPVGDTTEEGWGTGPEGDVPRWERSSCNTCCPPGMAVGLGGDSAGHQDRDRRWNMPLPGTRSCPITPPAAPFPIPSLQLPPSPCMKPGWPKCPPRCSLDKGNQPPHHQNDPDKTLRSWGLHPGVRLCQPLRLTSCPTKGSVPVLQGQEGSAPSPLLPCLSFPLVKGRGN